MVRSDIHKPPDQDPVAVAKAVRTTLAFARILGYDIKPGSSVLDFGCGTGRTVEALSDLGYDAWGVDTQMLWESSDRLRKLDLDNYRLPFPDHSFDFCMSEQVMEHVFDYGTVFSELARVMKPRSVSVHRFPGPGRLMEGHLMVPIPILCRSRAYLTACAMLGFRNSQQAGYGWRETVAENMDLMRFNNYPTKRTLRRYADQAGIKVAFMERREFLFRRGNRFLASMGPLLQRYMVLTS